MMEKLRIDLLASAIWALPLLFLIRLLGRIYPIRVGTFRVNRIGHFVADSSIRLAEDRTSTNGVSTLYWFAEEVANAYWLKLVRERWFNLSFLVYLERWDRIWPGSNSIRRESSTTGSRDILGLQEKHGKFYSFSDSENEAGISWLRQIGWNYGEPFVVLQVRDSAYLDSEYLIKSRQMSFDYHDYRDSDIDTYIEASEWLADNGVWVLRMGKVTKKKLVSHSKRIFDYSHCPSRSDFLDVWLFANASLCITTGSGPDAISDAFRVPLLCVNFCPVLYSISWSNALMVPKPLEWRQSGKYLTLKEHCSHAYLRKDFYDDNDICVKNLSSREILDSVIEAWSRVKGYYIEGETERVRQREFRQTLIEHDPIGRLHGWIHPEFRISSEFLRRYSSFMD